MSDESGRNRAEDVTERDVARALRDAGLPVEDGEPAAMLDTARFLRGAADRVRDAGR
jgi:hypothetical protein